jgi:hypothetical protein
VAINAFGGAYKTDGISRGQGFVGGELELVPLRISLFRFEDLIEGGLMLGASTLKHAVGNVATAHAGARLTFNLGDKWSITTAARANLGYIIGEAGVAIRL